MIREADPGWTARKLADLSEIGQTAFNAAFLLAMTSGPTFERAGELLLVRAGLAPGIEAKIFLMQGWFSSSGVDAVPVRFGVRRFAKKYFRSDIYEI